MKFEEIITDRLILRKFTQESFDAIYSDLSQDEQLDILGLNSVEKLLKEKEKYKNGLSTYNKKFLYHQLIDKKTSAIIGWCGFNTWYTDHNRAEIGYELFDDNYKSKGIMSEAIVSIVNYGFNNMNLERTYLKGILNDLKTDTASINGVVTPNFLIWHAYFLYFVLHYALTSQI